MNERIQDFEVNSPRWLSLEDFDGEVWKDIKGTIHPYQVSNMGRVKVLTFYQQRFRNKKTPYTTVRKTHIMYAHDNGHGYLWVALDGKKNTRRYIHRLVAEYFIPNPKNKPHIDHINTKRGDNRMINLRWVTRSENMCNPITSQRNKVAQGDPVVLLNCWGEYIGEYLSAQELADVLGVPSSVVKDTITQKRRVRTVLGFIAVRKKDYDINKDYSIIYKRGTSPYIYIPNEKMVLVFKQGILFTVFPNTHLAANAYDITDFCIARVCRISEGDVFYKPTYAISDTLCYYKDVSPEKQKEALAMFKKKYPPKSFL